MIAKISDNARDLIVRKEGIHSKKRDGLIYPYPDPAHGWSTATIGIGTTINPDTGEKITKDTQPITETKAIEWLEKDLERKYLPAVDKYTAIELHPDMRGAIASFVYNVGTGAYKGSTLRKRINARDWNGVAKEWRKWRLAGGRVFRGLEIRREEELSLFMAGLKEMQNGISQPSRKPLKTHSENIFQKLAKIFTRFFR